MNCDVVLLLGRRDEPTDAVEEYCRYLSDALGGHSVKSEVVRVPSSGRTRSSFHGWVIDLDELHRQAARWRGRWVLLQYTALAWSGRGFPRCVPRVLRLLKEAGVNVGVVFHDVEPFSGRRAIDIWRRRVQLRVMRQMLRTVDLAVFTVSLNVVSWLGSSAKAVFIPVGANLPETRNDGKGARDSAVTRIAVYGITGGAAGSEECSDIASAVRLASERDAKMELHVFGRGAAEREVELREKLKGVAVKLRFDGLLPADCVASAIRESDATLFVRGPISTRRGSAIAGIACGRPVVAYRGRETATPITEAGVVLVDRNNPAQLGEALLRIATDHTFREELSGRSTQAQESFFSWRAIADRYIKAMNLKT
jgi:glycosyltransferase involved in cell wall biosynthesis